MRSSTLLMSAGPSVRLKYTIRNALFSGKLSLKIRMRPITRQSGRLGCCSSCERLLVARARRQRFHSSAPYKANPRLPDSSAEHRLSNRRDGPQQDANYGRDDEQTTTPREDEIEVKTSGEPRRSSFRRGLKPRRAVEIPPPPPTPNWFLRDNVFLHRDSPGHPIRGETTQTVEVLKNGRTLFTIPYFPPLPKRYIPQYNTNDQENKKQDQGTIAAESQDARSSVSKRFRLEVQGTQGKPTSEGFFDYGPAFQGFRTDNTKKDNRSFEIENGKHDDKSSNLEVVRKVRWTPEIEQANEAVQDSSDAFKAQHFFNEAEFGPDAILYTMIELEASVRAAFSMSQIAAEKNSFAAERVDVSLQCPNIHSDNELEEHVKAIARCVEADVIKLDANDFSELLADYLEHGHDGPGTFRDMGFKIFQGMNEDGYMHSKFNSHRGEEDEDDDDGENHDFGSNGSRNSEPASATSLSAKALQAIGKSLHGQMVVGVLSSSRGASFQEPGRAPPKSDHQQEEVLDDARITVLLEQLLADASRKSPRASPQTMGSETMHQGLSAEGERFHMKVDHLRYINMQPRYWLMLTGRMLATHVVSMSKQDESIGFVKKTVPLSEMPRPASSGQRSTIVHVRGLLDLWNSSYGETIIQSLVRVVRKRRRAGERIVILGTTAQDSIGPVDSPGEPTNDFPFRPVIMPPARDFWNTLTMTRKEVSSWFTAPYEAARGLTENLRVAEINHRHIARMIERVSSKDDVLYDKDDFSAMLKLRLLSLEVLSYDDVQRLVLIAKGLAEYNARSHKLATIHLRLAFMLMVQADNMLVAWTKKMESEATERARARAEEAQLRGNTGEHQGSNDQNLQATKDVADSRERSWIERLRKSLPPHEARLLSGVVNPRGIKVNFADVRVSKETIEALRTVTTLALLRPDAFKYGVLAKDRLTGLLLYGPPGTGKTLLAKALAKESDATVLEVSGAQLYEKYVGEGEKMVRALFSLAKKLSPCIVFMDEADAILGSRNSSSQRNTHRDLINQFLKEWDGMDDNGVFIMVATNRPFDLDDAVLRRLPRRVLVDLPTSKDREAILGIHLKDEMLGQDVSLSKLADQTPLYSGSDLKNLAVAAALAAVREENTKKANDPAYAFPEKRLLESRHFEKALGEISASISENMSSLNAIRKFDEQFGDKRGKRKKSGYGFGAMDREVNEAVVRVRDTDSVQPVMPATGPSSTPASGPA